VSARAPAPNASASSAGTIMNQNIETIDPVDQGINALWL
jgi:hypothetical protein